MAPAPDLELPGFLQMVEKSGYAPDPTVFQTVASTKLASTPLFIKLTIEQHKLASTPSLY